MKIVEAESNTYIFRNIAGGQVFKYLNQVYMKLHIDYATHNNAICLDSGKMMCFTDLDEVVLYPDATLHLGDPD